jgi:sulfotransferase
VQNGIHFISGLPRAGSTLLAALLRQNPRFAAGMRSPVGSLFSAMLLATSQRNEVAVFIDDDQRARLLRGVFEAYYADIHPQQVVFDTERGWTTRLAAIAQFFPKATVICCVRNLAWVMDSIESLIRRNALHPSGIFNFDPGGTVYSRIEGLARTEGLVGFPLAALREAVYGPEGGRVLLVRYETLTANPLGTLAAIYSAIGEDLFAHNPNRIEPCYDTIEFDLRLGTPGLHQVGPRVQAPARPTILPPDLFARFERESFWENPANLPPNVRLL